MQLIIALGATTLVFMSILTLLSYRMAVYTHEKLALERLSMEVAEHGASLERLLRHQTHHRHYRLRLHYHWPQKIPEQLMALPLKLLSLN